MKAHWPDGLLPAGHTIKNGPGIYPARFFRGLAVQALKVSELNGFHRIINMVIILVGKVLTI